MLEDTKEAYVIGKVKHNSISTNLWNNQTQFQGLTSFLGKQSVRQVVSLGESIDAESIAEYIKFDHSGLFFRVTLTPASKP